MTKKEKIQASKSGLVIATVLAMLMVFVGPAYAQSQSLTVTTDRPSYAIGDTIIITVSIDTTGQDSTMPLVIQVIDPENTVVSTKVLETNENRKYTAELPTAGFESSGTYVIHVTSADNDQESTFEFKGQDSGPPKESLVVTFSNGTSLSIDAKLTEGIVTKITPVEESATLVFSVTTGTGDDTLQVVLPREIIDSKYEPGEMDLEGQVTEEESSFLVLVDGDYASYNETSITPTDRTLKILIPAGTEEVMIGGSSMIPEFPAPAIAVVSALLAVVIVGKTRFFKNTGMIR